MAKKTSAMAQMIPKTLPENDGTNLELICFGLALHS